jgi:hypothetical protein
MLDKVASLKFMDHDIIDMHKFPKLDRDQYLCMNTDPSTGKIWVEPHEFMSGLEKSRILKLFEIPHFR